MDDNEGQLQIVTTGAPFAHRVRAKVTKNTKGYGWEITAEVTDNGQPLYLTTQELAATIDHTTGKVRAAIKRQELLDAGYPVGPPVDGVDMPGAVESTAGPEEPPDELEF